MSQQNDTAWEKYISEKKIAFDHPFYVVDATDLKQITGREPRLLAKFDTPDQLPKPLKDAGYTLIPIRNGQYQIVRGDLFVELPRCANQFAFQPQLPFTLETAGRGSSESQYIDQAFNTGLLGQFLNLPDLYLTIRGREYTKRFEFYLAGQQCSVESVQIEVDAGYEGAHDIVLLEAKIGVPANFNVRQIYYPFRHFSILVPRKRVRNVFLCYDIPTTAYHLFEYRFSIPSDPRSETMVQCGIYKITPQKRFRIDELIDVNFQTQNNIAPQADDLNKIFELLLLIARGVTTSTEIADYFVFEQRQSNYYKEAAKFLGLISETDDALTELGILVLSQPPSSQAETFAKIIINSWLFEALIQKAGKERLFTNADIEAIIQSVTKPDGMLKYSGDTVQRRRRTIVAWIKWLAREMDCFVINDTEYKLQ